MMINNNAPRVKLPDVVERKPVVPGVNSWAQSQQQDDRQQRHQPRPLHEPSRSMMVTSGDKYKHKPMPALPDESPMPVRQQNYITPAIPLVSPNQKTQPPKNRSVTDPVAPKALFGGSRKTGVSGLRNKFSSSKPNAVIYEEVPIMMSLPDQMMEKKMAQVLSYKPGEEPQRNTSPVPVSAEKSPDSYDVSYIVPPANIAAHTRHNTSTPVPTRRYLEENGLSTPALVQTHGIAEHRADYQVQGVYKGPASSQEHMRTTGMLCPPKIGTHARIGGVDVVEGPGMHRIDSVAGIIENAAPCKGSENPAGASTKGGPFRPRELQELETREPVPSAVSTPSMYGGVWENDPAIGYSLPPFSPMPKGDAPAPETHTGKPNQKFASDMPRANHGNPSHAHPPASSITRNELGLNPTIDRLRESQHPFTSTNSWASPSRGNLLGSTNPPLSALLPRRWPYDSPVNSVPSPPHNQYDFQRSESIPAALAQIELTVHHHLDTIFASLSRLITDKHDRALDQMIRRLEHVEEVTSKGLRAMKGEVKDIKKDVGNLREDLKDAVSGNPGAKELIAGIEKKLQALDKHIQEHACSHESSSKEQSASGPEFNHHQQASSHRRAESAHVSFGQGDQRQAYESGATGPSNSIHQSGTSSRRDRSNTTSSPIYHGAGDEGVARRGYFAELAAAKGAVPDIRNHPAYAAKSQGQSLGNGTSGAPATANGPPTRKPSLGVGEWYQKAYGQNR